MSRYAGDYEHVFEATTAGISIQAPQLDINTVAAGGGSQLFFRWAFLSSLLTNPLPVCPVCALSASHCPGSACLCSQQVTQAKSGGGQAGALHQFWPCTTRSKRGGCSIRSAPNVLLINWGGGIGRWAPA